MIPTQIGESQNYLQEVEQNIRFINNQLWSLDQNKQSNDQMTPQPTKMTPTQVGENQNYPQEVEQNIRIITNQFLNLD